jgi:hypothetical protein
MKPLTATTHLFASAGTHRADASAAQNDGDPSGRQCRNRSKENKIPEPVLCIATMMLSYCIVGFAVRRSRRKPRAGLPVRPAPTGKETTLQSVATEIFREAAVRKIVRDGIEIHHESRVMKISVAPLLLAIALFAAAPATASTASSFTSLPNTPLAFGMDVEEVARVLGQPLRYVSGRPGNEIYLAFRNTSGNGLFPRRDLLYLQFRKGRLTGWKGDAGQNWIWQW